MSLQFKGMCEVVSPLLAARGFNMVDGIAIDWMHVVCLGVVRLLIDHWLNSRGELYFIGDKVFNSSHI